MTSGFLRRVFGTSCSLFPGKAKEHLKRAFCFLPGPVSNNYGFFVRRDGERLKAVDSKSTRGLKSLTWFQYHSLRHSELQGREK